MQSVDFMNTLDKVREQVAEKNSAVMGTCPEHGAYTHGDMIAVGVWWGDVCPECYKISEIERKSAERKSWAEKYIYSGQSGVPLRFREKTFGSYSALTEKAKGVLGIICSYAESFLEHEKNGVSLILCGKTGTGKTHLACAAIKYIAFNHNKGGLYTSAYRIVGDIKSSYSDRSINERMVIERFIAPALLVVDEVGVQFGTDTEKMLLFEVLNGRYEQMKPSIVISNLGQSEIAEYLGDRVMDRLKDNGGAVLAFDWDSHRQ